MPGPATAGQRLKLLGDKGKVLATLARPAAAGARALVLRGAAALAGGQVFVFGLEHPDVRAVDFEALAMLNVSATQELARQVRKLQQQLEAQTQRATCAESQATATTEAFEARLRRLEAGGAQARR